jgi:hypothetical protein
VHDAAGLWRQYRYTGYRQPYPGNRTRWDNFRGLAHYPRRGNHDRRRNNRVNGSHDRRRYYLGCHLSSGSHYGRPGRRYYGQRGRDYCFGQSLP